MPQSFDLSALENLFQYLVAAFGAFFAALWLSLIFWAYRDSQTRSTDRLMHILAALIVAVLGPLGMVIYAILRAPQTLEQAYQHTLEEEALLASVESSNVCPGCSARTVDTWQICPQCHTRLRKPCHQCGTLMELSWQICPQCATPVPGVRTEKDEEVLEPSG